MDEACARVAAKGRGTMLAKFDVERAFRSVPVHPDDRLLLECNGRAALMWIRSYLLGLGQHLSYTPL